MKPIGLLLRRLDALINEQFDHTLGRHDVSRRQWQLLNTLTTGAMTGAALTDAVAPFLDRAAGETATPHLEQLERRGLVEATDGVWGLTAAGRAAVGELADDVQAIRELTTAGIDEETYARTMATLETMVANLQSRSVESTRKKY